MHSSTNAAPDSGAEFDPTSGSPLERSIFNHRGLIVLLCALVTAVLCWQAMRLVSVLDLAMAMAALSLLKNGFTCATISLTANMQATGQEGHFIAVTGVDRVGRQIAFAHAKLYDAERSHLIAYGASSLAGIAER